MYIYIYIRPPNSRNPATVAPIHRCRITCGWIFPTPTQHRCVQLFFFLLCRSFAGIGPRAVLRAERTGISISMRTILIDRALYM